EARPHPAAARLSLRDQPAVRPGLPVPPQLLGVRARGGDRARQPSWLVARCPSRGPVPPVGRGRLRPRSTCGGTPQSDVHPDPRSL
ncbi:MAG: Membrane protein insertion efficiency factor YidD, partial [uncultured Nocardioidaceae bacterium]